MCICVNVHIIKALLRTNIYSMDLGVNGAEAVSSRPMAVCRPMDCSCIVVELQMSTEVLYTSKIYT